MANSAHRRADGDGVLGRRSSDRGEVAVEAAIVVPILLFFMIAGLTVAGRSVQARNQAESAAQEAARAASMQQTPAAATSAGLAALQANVTDVVGLTCSGTIDVGELSPGSSVVADVICDVDLVAGRQATFRASAIEVVDRFREGEAVG